MASLMLLSKKNMFQVLEIIGQGLFILLKIRKMSM